MSKKHFLQIINSNKFNLTYSACRREINLVLLPPLVRSAVQFLSPCYQRRGGQVRSTTPSPGIWPRPATARLSAHSNAVCSVHHHRHGTSLGLLSAANHAAASATASLVCGGGPPTASPSVRLPVDPRCFAGPPPDDPLTSTGDVRHVRRHAAQF